MERGKGASFKSLQSLSESKQGTPVPVARAWMPAGCGASAREREQANEGFIFIQGLNPSSATV